MASAMRRGKWAAFLRVTPLLPPRRHAWMLAWKSFPSLALAQQNAFGNGVYLAKMCFCFLMKARRCFQRWIMQKSAAAKW